MKNRCLGCVLKVLLWGWYPAWNTSAPSQDLDSSIRLHIGLLIVFISLEIMVRLKKRNSMSQSLWQIGRPDLNAFFFFFLFSFFFFSFPEHQTCQIWVSHNFVQYEIYGTSFLDKQDTRQYTELKKSVVQSVYSDKQVHKKLGEKKLSKKIKSWILLNQTPTEKQTRSAPLRHTIYFL